MQETIAIRCVPCFLDFLWVLLDIFIGGYLGTFFVWVSHILCIDWCTIIKPKRSYAHTLLDYVRVPYLWLLLPVPSILFLASLENLIHTVVIYSKLNFSDCNEVQEAIIGGANFFNPYSILKDFSSLSMAETCWASWCTQIIIIIIIIGELIGFVWGVMTWWVDCYL